MISRDQGHILNPVLRHPHVLSHPTSQPDTPQGQPLPGQGLADTWTARPGLSVPSPRPASGLWGQGHCGNCQHWGRSQLSPHPLLNVGQFWGWHRLTVPAQCHLCDGRYVTRGGQHQNKHLVMSRSAPVPDGEEDAPKGWGRTLLPRGSLLGPCLREGVVGLLGSG